MRNLELLATTCCSYASVKFLLGLKETRKCLIYTLPGVVCFWIRYIYIYIFYFNAKLRYLYTLACHACEIYGVFEQQNKRVLKNRIMGIYNFPF